MVRILHRSETVVVVDKPTGVPVHATRGAVGTPMLQRLRDALGQRVWPLHRLDAATSGALAFGLAAETASALAPRFGTDAVEKRYVALVRGVPPDAGVIDHPVPRSAGGPRVPAVTLYRRVWTTGRYSLVAVRPGTGRRHQIRRHLKHESWPLIGDVRYGKGDHNRWARSELGLHRLALHATFLGLDDGARRIRAEAELPPDLADPLMRLGVSPDLLRALPATALPSPPAPRVGVEQSDCLGADVEP